jgi:hypothetical protein
MKAGFFNGMGIPIISCRKYWDETKWELQLISEERRNKLKMISE